MTVELLRSAYRKYLVLCISLAPLEPNTSFLVGRFIGEIDPEWKKVTLNTVSPFSKERKSGPFFTDLNCRVALSAAK